MPFAVPLVWREPKEHHSDCYFCVSKIAGFSKKTKSKIVYPDCECALRPVPHDAENPVPVPSTSVTVRDMSDEEQEDDVDVNKCYEPQFEEGTEGRANPDSSFSSGDAGKNNNLLQPEATTNSSDVSEIETFSKEGVEEQAESPMVDKLISEATVHTDCVSSAQDDITEGSSSLECSSPTTKDTATRDGITGEKLIINADGKTGEQGQFFESGADQKCSRESPSRAQHQAAVEFIASLLNGDLKESESFLAQLEFQEETFSEEEMSPSPGETVLGDSFLSLDELAKRIEIEEVRPVAGLVSILKKRDGSEGDQTFQSSQKPAKRKVRFQETEDALEQEEISGGSCILLIALCLLTVFLSIGGTALYCTFGDINSSVCKDFAANMDFYYTRAVQGIDELRHWLFVT
uniref:Consortin C-terminal domain-containing protein n=1 Tax=Pyxicephalus adspersus TaxID=30357 RepID=A0AAV3AW12_PYXAD|nr:TPA: hypothetical protein GDO54_011101 [Pyxicephalus adspersus]